MRRHFSQAECTSTSGRCARICGPLPHQVDAPIVFQRGSGFHAAGGVKQTTRILHDGISTGVCGSSLVLGNFVGQLLLEMLQVSRQKPVTIGLTHKVYVFTFSHVLPWKRSAGLLVCQRKVTVLHSVRVLLYHSQFRLTGFYHP